MLQVSDRNSIQPVAVQGFMHTYWTVQWRFSCNARGCEHVKNVLWNDVKQVFLNTQSYLFKRLYSIQSCPRSMGPPVLAPCPLLGVYRRVGVSWNLQV